MEIKLAKWGWRFYFTVNLRRIVKVRGVNSRLADGKHFLMWDFDGSTLLQVCFVLLDAQDAHKLPPISIISTGKEGGYHAYCFKRCTWEQCRGIIAGTARVDRHYLMAGIGREYFTLRFTDLSDRGFEPICSLDSEVKADVEYSEVSSSVEYTRAK